jgi:tryptophan 2,3-dioxygenase
MRGHSEVLFIKTAYFARSQIGHMSKDTSYTSIHYHQYLHLDELLGAQQPRSDAAGQPAHDEVLFIIVHQVYELWFKQIIHELHAVMAMFQTDAVNERSVGVAVARMERIIAIQKLLIEQIHVMETMTPLDFLDFRHYLFPASGFQSFQFRQVEVLLGLPHHARLTYNNQPYHSVFMEEQRHTLEALEQGGTLFDALERWLERTPFLDFGGFRFLDAYRQAVERMMGIEKDNIRQAPLLDEEAKTMRLQILQANEDYIFAVLDPTKHQQMIKEGRMRLSYRAMVGALLIHLYRDEPILRQPYLLLQRVSEIDEWFTAWRMRHAQMVLRMLGRKMGTGGSSGHEYLAATTAKHTVYQDLHSISTLLIPRSELPVLPEEVQRNLRFHYTVKNES